MEDTMPTKTQTNHKDYSNGKIYIIRNSENDSTYIGSTTQKLSERMAQHRKATRNPRAFNYKIYRFINEIGIDKFYIELIEYYPCSTNEELHRREGEIIREWKPDLNKHVAGRTMKEYKVECVEQIRERDRKRHALNKDARLQQRKQPFECCCGSTIRRDGKAEHERTKKHQDFLNQNF